MTVGPRDVCYLLAFLLGAGGVSVCSEGRGGTVPEVRGKLAGDVCLWGKANLACAQPPKS